MGSKIKKGIALLISAVVAATTCVTTIPGLSETVYATGTGKYIQLGAGALEDNVNTANAATVYYGNNGDTWRVIGYNGTGVASSSGTMTLIASGNLDHGAFDSSGHQLNNYSESNLKSMIENLAGGLSTEETSAVVKRTLEGGSGNLLSGPIPYDDNKIKGDDVPDVVMWPLSVAEFNSMNTDLRQADPANSSLIGSYWWLRSPGYATPNVATVWGNGHLDDYGVEVGDYEVGVRPAFNLNLSSILFTSDTFNVKVPDVNAGDLLAPDNHSSANWKLTVLSNSLSVSSGTVTRSGNTITVPFTASGSYYRISVFISDRTWNESGAELKYYGALDRSGSSGTFTLPSDFDSSWKVYIIAEDINDGTSTDYASTPTLLTIPGAAAGGSSSGPATSPSPSPSVNTGSSDSKPEEEPTYDYLDELRAKIAAAIALGGKQTVTWDQGTLLPYDIMKTLQDNPNITLVFSYRYLNKDYKVTLPGKKVKAYANIPFYGPLYLNAYYGEKSTARKTTKTKADN